MIADLLKARFLILKANELEDGDFDRLNRLHEIVLTPDTENDKVSDEIDKLYCKYRFTVEKEYKSRWD